MVMLMTHEKERERERERMERGQERADEKLVSRNVWNGEWHRRLETLGVAGMGSNLGNNINKYRPIQGLRQYIKIIHIPL